MWIREIDRHLKMFLEARATVPQKDLLELVRPVMPQEAAARQALADAIATELGHRRETATGRQ
jgi:hypothetical protein